MKAKAIGALIGRVCHQYVVAAHVDKDMVQLPPLPGGQWRQDRVELREAAEALFDPASILSDDEVLNAALTREVCIEGMLEQLTDEALIGELARRGKWVLEQPEGELERLRAASKAAEKAITHTLVRAREDAEGLGYYLGPYTESFESLVRALALLLGRDAGEVRNAALGRAR